MRTFTFFLFLSSLLSTSAQRIISDFTKDGVRDVRTSYYCFNSDSKPIRPCMYLTARQKGNNEIEIDLCVEYTSRYTINIEHNDPIYIRTSSDSILTLLPLYGGKDDIGDFSGLSISYQTSVSYKQPKQFLENISQGIVKVRFCFGERHQDYKIRKNKLGRYLRNAYDLILSTFSTPGKNNLSDF